MPKKWNGENSKSAQARMRKEDKKLVSRQDWVGHVIIRNIFIVVSIVFQEEKEKKEKEAEDSYWRDNDKNAQRKQERKVSHLF